jgi:opacity protein-like surface antigen
LRFAVGNNYGNGSNSHVGYTVGGIEWMFLPNWSVNAEYLYCDLRRNNNNNGQLLSHLRSSLRSTRRFARFFDRHPE